MTLNDFQLVLPRRTRAWDVTVAIAATLILFYQFLPMAHFFIPFEVAGKNVYTVAPVAITLLLFLVLWPGIKRTTLPMSVALLLLVLIFTWTIVFAARWIFYESGGDLLFQRFIVSLFLYCIIFMHLTRDHQTRELLGTCMIIVAVVQSVIGIIHAHMFPFIELVFNEEGVLVISLEGNGTREMGTLVSASIFAGVIVCGQCVLLCQQRLRFSTKLILMCLMTYAATLSGSRYPTVVSVLLTAWLLLSRRVERASPLVVSGAALLGALVVFLRGLPTEITEVVRFDEDAGGRFEKLVLAIDVMTQHWRHWLIGAPEKIIEAAATIDGITLSDNSYALIALQFGLPLLVIWLACSCALIVRRPPGLLAGFMVVYFFVNLGITNSILWELWLFYFSLALWVVRRRSAETDLLRPMLLDLEKRR